MELCIVHHAAIQKVLHQPPIGIDHPGIGFENIQRVLAADGTVAPFPKVQRKLAVPHFLCNLDRQKVVTAVLVAFDIRMPDDVVIQKELPAVYLPVNKRTVLFVREENRPPSSYQ